MRVLILGGDGYLGWPTAMNLTASGHQVAVVDNYLRRNICREEDSEALFNVPNLHDRVKLWKEISGHKIDVHIGDLCEWDFISNLFIQTKPEAVIHYAEQPSAPYSMLNRNAATLTIKNNINVTTNIIFAVKKYASDAQIIKIGTMGEYGTPNIDIEEGWIDIEHKGRKQKFLYPRQAGSLYHTTKVMGTDLLWFYVRMWDLKVTDLMQGPVYGLHTDENQGNENLFPFFNYDELFGTVVNRFIVQAVAGYPLTVYGKGGQTRGYLDIRDTLQCVKLSMENPAKKGELRIFNQFVETFSVNQLADKIQQAGKRFNLDVQIKPLPNPRKEAEDHYYNPAHTGLLDLGLKPHYLTEDILSQMMETVLRYKDKIKKSSIFRGVKWQ
ncbi:MAG: NAD-dependent epimerase/dehydratase family protein [Desulfobacula sp.]|uniref:NAD-dependent epimerase/dehydratase family protein n=1 Tax=Desulfobacula sp. TaxID=2593537 RepID=UPI0025BD03AE|nr:NAD-dependent epimerase/dehydratase family protein [Desulfobacula sp.]MCD4720414.1 NAD-dependent epimerase/dehydratase family protein [Desulfobacula sp.]